MPTRPTPQAAGGGGQRPAFTGIYRSLKSTAEIGGVAASHLLLRRLLATWLGKPPDKRGFSPPATAGSISRRKATALFRPAALPDPRSCRRRCRRHPGVCPGRRSRHSRSRPRIQEARGRSSPHRWPRKPKQQGESSASSSLAKDRRSGRRHLGRQRFGEIVAARHEAYGGSAKSQSGRFRASAGSLPIVTIRPSCTLSVAWKTVQLGMRAGLLFRSRPPLRGRPGLRTRFRLLCRLPRRTALRSGRCGRTGFRQEGDSSNRRCHDHDAAHSGCLPLSQLPRAHLGGTPGSHRCPPLAVAIPLSFASHAKAQRRRRVQEIWPTSGGPTPSGRQRILNGRQKAAPLNRPA